MYSYEEVAKGAYIHPVSDGVSADRNLVGPNNIITRNNGVGTAYLSGYNSGWTTQGQGGTLEISPPTPIISSDYSFSFWCSLPDSAKAFSNAGEFGEITLQRISNNVRLLIQGESGNVDFSFPYDSSKHNHYVITKTNEKIKFYINQECFLSLDNSIGSQNEDGENYYIMGDSDGAVEGCRVIDFIIFKKELTSLEVNLLGRGIGGNFNTKNIKINHKNITFYGEAVDQNNFVT